jgi:hypothetical protein
MEMNHDARRAQRQLAILAGAATVVSLILLGLPPLSSRIPLLLSVPARLGIHACPLLAVTGIACPGCGGTRAFIDLSNADLAGALAMNPLVTLATLGVVLLAAMCAVAPAAGDRLLTLVGSALRTRGGRIGLAALLGLQMIQRSL